MATVAFTRPATTAPRAITRATGESPAVRWTLTAVALVFLALTLLLPLVLVFHEALAKGVETYLAAVREPDALSAARLEALLAPLKVASHSATFETNLAFRPQVPWDQGLMTYAYNIHRDWSWGREENDASFALVDAALAGAPPGRTLVLGAGAGRLAYDVHMRTSADATVVLDFNPFLLLLAQTITSGGTVGLYEFPRAPKSLDDCAVLRTLERTR